MACINIPKVGKKEGFMETRTQGRIHSKGGSVGDIVVVDHANNNRVIVSYKGNLCTAIYNVFVGSYYVDDIYGIIGEDPNEYTKKGE